MEDPTLQLVLIKPSDFVLEEPVEVTHFDNLLGSCKLNSPFFGVTWVVFMGNL
jgi:hypothetical protein